MFNLEDKIIKKFALFQGKRDESEDEEIFNKIYSLALNEAGRFIEENLSKEKAKDFLEKLEEVDSEDLEKTEKVLLEIESELDKIPYIKVKLAKRLESFINNLHYQVLESKKN